MPLDNQALIDQRAAGYAEGQASAQAELKQARAYARILAHAYTTDTRPPSDVVEAALAFKE